MSIGEMVYEMVHHVLSNADIKVICKSRGFSDKEAASRSLFENVFLSSTGLEAAMSTLSLAEVTALHLLHMENRTVDISFFNRVYGGEKGGWRGTYTQQFKPIFDSVQTGLVRKGLLILTEAKTNSPTKTKMELWRYAFPPEFGAFLPSLFTAMVNADQPGSIKADRFRAELAEALKRNDTPKRVSMIKLTGGTLYLGSAPFSVKRVEDWQRSAWEQEIAQASRKPRTVEIYEPSTAYLGYMFPSGEYRNPTPLPFVVYALSQLQPDEWIAPDQMDTLLDIFYGSKKHPESTVHPACCAAAAMKLVPWRVVF